MNKKMKEPFHNVRIANFILGIVLLILVTVILFQEKNRGILEIILFGLAALENFTGATISFSTQRKVRGNLYAVIGAVFLIVAAILAVRHF